MPVAFKEIKKSPKMIHRAKAPNDLLLFSGNSNPALAKEIARYIGKDLGRCTVNRFADGEVNVHIDENVRGKDCFVVQPTCRPVNESVMELLLLFDALRRASAGRITGVVPYFGYARGDRKTAPRVPISAKLLANLITVAGASRLITVDLHAGQIQGFFDIPVDHLYATKIFLDYAISKKLDNIVVVSPDVGGVERARAFAKRVEGSLAIIDKRRPRPNEAHVYNIVGDVDGKTAVIIDDIVDTAGTLTEVAGVLKARGAHRIFALVTHGVLSGPAISRLEHSSIEELAITNSIPLVPEARGCRKVRALSVAGLLGEAILRNHGGESISALFI